MPKKEKINTGHWHEACDRTHCVMEIIQTMLLDHPAIDQDIDLRMRVEAAQNILGEVYQLTGQKI